MLSEAPNPLPIPSAPPGAKVVAIDADLLRRVQMALQKQRQIIKNLVGKDKLDRREEDVIDIVGMLFEAMLNEKLLANSVKTLLSHLHTRYLKIAVQSQDFLENSAHPARRLFERMLDAGIKWVREDKLRAGIYPQLQEIVTRILGHKTLEGAFFEAQIAELDSAEKKLEQQSTAAEDRTLEAERGRARLEQAKAIVKQTVDEISADIEVAPAVITFPVDDLRRLPHFAAVAQQSRYRIQCLEQCLQCRRGPYRCGGVRRRWPAARAGDARGPHSTSRGAASAA